MPALLALIRRAPTWTLVVAATCALVFAALGVLVMLGATRAGDLGWMRAFQSIASYPLDVLANAHTVVGQLAITLPLSVAMALVARRRLGGYAWLGPLFILATGGIELVFKNVAAHPGPPREFIRAFGNPLGIPRELHPAFSFPSGHVTRIAFLAVIVAALWPRTWVWSAAAGFVALSVFLRVYIGDHWISDALAGLALGSGVGALAVGWMRATAHR